MNSHLYTVHGTGQFPIDMLRHDCAWPVSPDDAANIAASVSGAINKFEVRLCSHQRPTIERWRSFLCVVEESTWT